MFLNTIQNSDSSSYHANQASVIAAIFFGLKVINYVINKRKYGVIRLTIVTAELFNKLKSVFCNIIAIRALDLE